MKKERIFSLLYVNFRKYTLGIESSCDDSSISIQRNTISIEKNKPQWDEYKKYGGIVPIVAANCHRERLNKLYDECIEEYTAQCIKKNINLEPIESIAITTVPGMVPCLRAGLEFATTFQAFKYVPIYPIHHIEAHILAIFKENKDLQFPFLALILSGGHSQIVLCHQLGIYTVLSTTLDDAFGDVCDKTCRTLQLDFIDINAVKDILKVPYKNLLDIKNFELLSDSILKSSPGAVLEQCANLWEQIAQVYQIPEPLSKIQLNIPCKKPSNCNSYLSMSFSGLRTQIPSILKKLDILYPNNKVFIRLALASAFQKAIFEHVFIILQRSLYFIKYKPLNISYSTTSYANTSTNCKLIDKTPIVSFKDISSSFTYPIVFCGGVACNSTFFRLLKERFSNHLFYRPSNPLCTDNATMNPVHPKDINVMARAPLGPLLFVPPNWRPPRNK